jgi:predicted alpha/beta hydrolase
MADTDVTLLAPDGRALAATLFTPDRETGPAVLVAGATGVPRGFYRRFAEWLAAQGATVLTLDYRGIGGSRHPDGPRRDAATMAEWGSIDLNTGLDYLIGRDPLRPVTVVGHSAGGWLLSFAPNAQLVSAVLTVASQSGYWRNWRGRARYARFVQWHFALPALVGVLKALPGRLFGGEALPAGVARDWARWGRRPGFVDGAGALPADRRYAGPLLAVAVPGDPFAPEHAVGWLPNLYPGARSQVHVLEPRHRPLGHFGAFRSGAAPLWAEAWRWLLAATAGRGEQIEDAGRPRR